MRLPISTSAFAVCALFAATGCSTTAPSRTQEVLRSRPPLVIVRERSAALSARPADCTMQFVKQDPEGAARTRKVARLVASGMGLDRAQAEKLLGEKACVLGADRVFIESEAYGRTGERDEVEAVAYAFDSPVHISYSGIIEGLSPKPSGCHIGFLRTKQPEARYQEVAGLHLKLPVVFDPGGPAPQVRAMEELRAAACHLGADAVLLTQETYELPGLGTVVSGTAIVFEENLRREKPPRPGEQTL